MQLSGLTVFVTFSLLVLYTETYKRRWLLQKDRIFLQCKHICPHLGIIFIYFFVVFDSLAFKERIYLTLLLCHLTLGDKKWFHLENENNNSNKNVMLWLHSWALNECMITSKLPCWHWWLDCWLVKSWEKSGKNWKQLPKLL